MPFESEKQRRFLWLKHPDIAKRWAHKYGNKPRVRALIKRKKNESNEI